MVKTNLFQNHTSNQNVRSAHKTIYNIFDTMAQPIDMKMFMILINDPIVVRVPNQLAFFFLSLSLFSHLRLKGVNYRAENRHCSLTAFPFLIFFLDLSTRMKPWVKPFAFVHFVNACVQLKNYRVSTYRELGVILTGGKKAKEWIKRIKH